MVTRGLSMLVVILLAGIAHASTIPVPSGGFGWVSIDPFISNGNGIPYFDHSSADGNPPGGIWPILNGQGIPDSRLQFWGDTGGGWDPDIKFDLTSGTEAVSLVLRFELAENASVNEFGWFAADLGGDGYQSSDLHPIFAGSATPGTSVVVPLPSGAYGFYLRNTVPHPDLIFLSQSGLSPTDTNNQHFAVFRDSATPNTLWIGIDDLKLSSGDQDYNDLVVTASIAHTPEPGTLLLLGSGVAATGFALRRRRGVRDR